MANLTPLLYPFYYSLLPIIYLLFYSLSSFSFIPLLSLLSKLHFIIHSMFYPLSCLVLSGLYRGFSIFSPSTITLHHSMSRNVRMSCSQIVRTVITPRNRQQFECTAVNVEQMGLWSRSSIRGTVNDIFQACDVRTEAPL